ncbi:unnamed protein product [Ectocarpus sp. 12 AP-2014]
MEYFETGVRGEAVELKRARWSPLLLLLLVGLLLRSPRTGKSGRPPTGAGADGSLGCHPMLLLPRLLTLPLLLPPPQLLGLLLLPRLLTLLLLLLPRPLRFLPLQLLTGVAGGLPPRPLRLLLPMVP